MSNIKDLTKYSGYVVFSVPVGCKHCDSLKMLLESNGKAPGIDYEYIDASVDVVNTSRFGVRGLPTVVLLENGNVVDSMNSYRADLARAFFKLGGS